MIYKQIEVATQDGRGSIADIFWKESFEHAAIIRTPTASPAHPTIRGNHFHKLSTQAIFIVEGALNYWYEGVNADGSWSGHVRAVHVPRNGLVITPPLEVHALEIIEPTTFIAFSRGQRGGDDYESDTYRVDNIVRMMR